MSCFVAVITFKKILITIVLIVKSLVRYCCFAVRFDLTVFDTISYKFILIHCLLGVLLLKVLISHGHVYLLSLLCYAESSVQ